MAEGHDPLAKLRTGLVDKQWQLDMLAQVIHKQPETLTMMERSALFQAHVVFAFAESEALMKLHCKWWKQRGKPRPKADRLVDEWSKVAEQALGSRWPRLNAVDWANDENQDAKTLTAWLAGLEGLRNHIVHPSPADASIQSVIARAGLPVDPWQLDEAYLDRFNAMSTKTNAVMFFVSQALQVFPVIDLSNATDADFA